MEQEAAGIGQHRRVGLPKNRCLSSAIIREIKIYTSGGRKEGNLGCLSD